MKKTLKNIAEGKFEYEEDSLRFSVQRLQFMCRKDEEIKDSFFIESQKKREIKGILYSSNARVKCEKVQFAGKRVEFPFIFQAKGLDPLTTVKGDIFLETNIGEYNIPFVVTVMEEYPKTSLGKIKNLFHFADLAHQNYEEAYKLFVSKKFLCIDMNEQERMYYRMFASKGYCRENMEEFLLAVRKKKEMAFKLSKQDFNVRAAALDFSQSVTITKNGWGYIRIDVSCEADFVRLEKKQLEAEDFLGNHLEYAWSIDVSKLHAGYNYAQILFSNFSQEETVDLLVQIPAQQQHFTYLEMKKMWVRLCELYMQVRCKRIHTLSWVKESILLVEKLLSYSSENEFLQLFQAHLYLLNDKKENARFILDKFKKKRNLKKQNPSIYAYWLYIYALYRKNEDYTIEAAREAELLLATFPQEHGVLWALLFLENGMQTQGQRKCQMMRKQYQYGCHSPFLYMEAMLLFQQDFSLMDTFDAFTAHVLNFGAHQAMITEEIAVYAAQRALSCRQYNKLIVRLLKHFYYFYERLECVEAICSLLIKGGKRTADCFEWYERGVVAGLKLNLLYEYYLYTVSYDRKELLPKSMLLYFLYNHQLDYRKRAYLYANVIRHKEEIEDIYEKYEPDIYRFAADQMASRHLSEDLIFLYKAYFELLTTEQKNRELFEEFLFVRQFQCQNRKVVRVAVGYKELNKEEVFSVTDGKCFIRVYTDDAYVALEDAKGRRHLKTLDFTIKPLFYVSEISKFAERLDGVKTGFLLNRYRAYAVITEKEGAKLCRKLINSSDVKAEFVQELLFSMIRFFEKQGADDELERLFDMLDFEMMSSAQRAYYIEKMILLAMYEKAFDLTIQFGFEGINVKRLVRLCSRRLALGFDGDALMDLCVWVFFKGKYDEETLKFLAEGYCGTTSQMIMLWQAVRNFEMEAQALSERILTQMLFTGYLSSDSDLIFEYYCRQLAKPEVIKAYVSSLSHDYVVYEQVAKASLFDWIVKLWRENMQLYDECYLAFLKYYSEKNNNAEIGDWEQKLLLEKLSEFTQKGIVMKFFKYAARRVHWEDESLEKTYVEYRANPNDKLAIHYRIIDETGETADFVTEQMNPLFANVFSKEFTLFSGETLQYYLARQCAGSEDKILCSFLIKKEADWSGELNGRISWLNEMYAARHMRDETSLESIMKKYAVKEKIVDELFQLKE